MEIVLSIILFICVIALIFSIYISTRNFKVRSFRLLLIEMSYGYELRRLRESGKRSGDEEDAFDWFLNKYSYEEQLFSLKPLKLKYWYTEEELKEINR